VEQRGGKDEGFEVDDGGDGGGDNGCWWLLRRIRRK